MAVAAHAQRDAHQLEDVESSAGMGNPRNPKSNSSDRTGRSAAASVILKRDGFWATFLEGGNDGGKRQELGRSVGPMTR